METEHTVVVRHREKGNGEYRFTNDYEVIKCNGCGDVSFRSRSMDEDMWHNQEPEIVTYYPLVRSAGSARRAVESWPFLADAHATSAGALWQGEPLAAGPFVRAPASAP